MNLRDFFLRPAVVTMADTPQIEKRLRAILEAKQQPGGTDRRIGRAGAAAAALFTLAAFASLAVLRPVAVRAQQTPGDDTTAAAQNERQVECLSRLKQLGTAFVMYTQDYDDTMPPLGSPAQMRNRISPYVRREAAAFICPETNRPYQPVARLGGKVLALQVSDPSKTMFIHDAVPHPAVPGSAAVNGLWSVGYVDGHVEAVATLPAIPALRPLPLAEQRARAARDRARAARQRLRLQELRWNQKQQQRLGADAVRPQDTPAQFAATRVRNQALVAQYAAEVESARAALSLAAARQRDRDQGGEERLRSSRERQIAQAQEQRRLALAQAQLAAARRKFVLQEKRDFVADVLRHNQSPSGSRARFRWPTPCPPTARRTASASK